MFAVSTAAPPMAPMAGGSGDGPALILIALLVVSAAGIAVAFMARNLKLTLLAGVASIGLGVQVFHSFEHVGQFIYWLGHPAEKPWMTSLGMSIHSSFAKLMNLTPPEATEVMHLIGNGVFLAGTFALFMYVRQRRDSAPAAVQKGARWGLMLETMHMVEHAALTATIFAYGRPIGLTTGFGEIAPGPGLWAYRITWHLVFNLVPIAVVGNTLVKWRLSSGGDDRKAKRTSTLIAEA